MNAGRKATGPSEHLARGTFQKSRHAGQVEIIGPDTLPQQPDWLTEGGQQVWLDDIGRVSTVRSATELDSVAFANYCNLQAAIIQAWRAGEVPPAAHLMQVRQMQEQFRIFGDKSRIKIADGKKSSNPYARNAK